MTEWLGNEVSFRIKGFALVQKYHFISPHSVIPSSFLNDEMKSNWVEYHWNDISLLWFSFLFILDILKWWRNDGMRRNASVFLGEEKTGFWDTSHSTIIRSFQCHSNLYTRPSFDHWWIWNWPSNWNGISMRNDAQMTEMTSEWFNMVLSLLKRQQHIKSFRSHSFHSRLILKRMSSSEIEWGMMLKWQECPLNDLIWCCLF